ncbi:MAG: TIGR02206 family membrane protein [Spirochaetales bacterium]|nr:TIGR02206 family membrane protein [Spirochaetales bacterium]
MTEKFEHGSTEHWAILFLTISLPVILIRLSRSPGASYRIRLSLALILISNFLVYLIYRIKEGYWEMRYDLPMEFCNWSTAFTILALFTGNRRAAELSYYWVSIGSIHGLLTPDLQVTSGHIYYFVFWVGHAGLVVAAAFVVFGQKLYPAPGSGLRAMLVAEIYFVTALLTNYLLDANYGFLSAPPGGGSLIDHLGPWPYYLISMQGLMALGTTVAYLPFYLISGFQAR